MLFLLWIVVTPSSTKILLVGNLKNMASSSESRNLDFELSVAIAALSQTFAFLTRSRIPWIQQGFDDRHH